MKFSQIDEQDITINLPPAPQYPTVTQRLQKPRRNITFKEEVKIFEIPNVRELSKSHLSEMYMTREEMAIIHAEAWENVELMDLGISYAESDHFSKRGISDLRGECVERRRRLREQAYKVVFGLQNIHGGTKSQRPYSPQIMAELYCQVSLPAKSHAHKTAMYDAIAAGQR